MIINRIKSSLSTILRAGKSTIQKKGGVERLSENENALLLIIDPTLIEAISS